MGSSTKHAIRCVGVGATSMLTTVASAMSIGLFTTPAAPSPPNMTGPATIVTVNQPINASGSYDVAPGESAVTAVEVYWMHNNNPPNFPGQPGTPLVQKSAILYGWTPKTGGGGTGNYTLFRNGQDVRIKAVKNGTATGTYYITIEPFGAVAPYYDSSGNLIWESAGTFEF